MSFVSAMVTGQNHGSFGSKVWHLRVVNRRVMGGEVGEAEKYDVMVQK